MERGVIRIRRFLPVAVEAHAGWLGAFVVLVGLSAREISVRAAWPGGSPTVALLFAGALAIAIALSFVLHDSAHILLTRIGDGSQQWLELYPIGSMPSDLAVPTSQRRELFISLGGAAVSAVTALAFSALYLFIDLSPPARTLVGAMLLTNAVLFLANLLPAHPFDGGRILRALFWYLHSNFMSGVRVAFLMSQVIGALVLGYGVFLMSWTDAYIVLGLWCVVGGWAITRAARNDLDRSSVVAAAGSLLAEDAVRAFNPTVRASGSLVEAIDTLLDQRGHGPGLVRDGTIFTGILTLSLIRRIPRSHWTGYTAAEACVPLEAIPSALPGDSLIEAIRLLRQTGAHWILIQDSRGQVIGVIDHSISLGALVRRAVATAVDKSPG